MVIQSNIALFHIKEISNALDMNESYLHKKRAEKSPIWESAKITNGVYFYYDSLKPEYKTKIKEKLCNNLDPLEFHIQKLKQEKEDLIIAQKKEAEQRKQALILEKAENEKRMSNDIFDRLKNAIETGYIEVFPKYHNLYPNKRKKQEFEAKKEVLFAEILKLDSIGYSKVKIFAAVQLINADYGNILPVCKKSFYRTLKNIELNGIETVIKHRLTGKKGNACKLTAFHISQIEAYYSSSQPLYTQKIITELVNIQCAEKGLKPISASSVKQHLAKKDVKNRLLSIRNPEMFKNNIVSHVNRIKALNPADLYQADGSPLQIWRRNDKNKLVRLNLFVIIDVFSNKIVGFDISETEDRFDFINSLHMAAKLHGVLPKELVIDNASWTKTDEFKALNQNLNDNGMFIRTAKVGNPEDKANVERFFGTFNSMYVRYMDGWLGEGIKSKRDFAHPEKVVIQQFYKDKNNVPTLLETKKQIAELISKYNSDLVDGISPNMKFKAEKTNAPTLSPEQIAFLFWKEKTIKVRKSFVKITVEKQEYLYLIKDHYLKLKLNGDSVIVRYDEHDLSSISLFNPKNNQFYCNCEQEVLVHQAIANQTDEDVNRLMGRSSHIKAFKKFTQNLTDETFRKGMESVGDEHIEILNPLSLKKNDINNNEDHESRIIYNMLDVEQVPESKSIANVTKSKFITLNKPKNNAGRYDEEFKNETEFKVVKIKSPIDENEA